MGKIIQSYWNYSEKPCKPANQIYNHMRSDSWASYKCPLNVLLRGNYGRQAHCFPEGTNCCSRNTGPWPLRACIQRKNVKVGRPTGFISSMHLTLQARESRPAGVKRHGGRRRNRYFCVIYYGTFSPAANSSLMWVRITKRLWMTFAELWKERNEKMQRKRRMKSWL